MSAWSDLPNAKHIDAVLASVEANPDKWAEALEKAGGWTEARVAALDAAWDAAWYVVRDAAWNAAWYVVRDAAWNAALEAVGDAAWDTARNAARSAILALIAYDDCAHLLTTNPDHVKMLAGIGNEVAILLHPATLVFSEIKNECLV